MSQDLIPNQSPLQSWWNARLLISLLLILVYGWTIFEPYAGDALMHMIDDTQIHSLNDVFRVFYSNTNPLYQEEHRLTVFHRPVFNELYVTAIKAIFGVGSPWIRVSTLVMCIASASVFIACIRKMKLSIMAATTGASWLVFSPSLFFGLYEFGLAFTQLLVLLALVSIYALIKYLESDEKFYSRVWLCVFLFLVFLTVFTKESAVVWPIVCLCILAGVISERVKPAGSPVSFKVTLRTLILNVLRHRLLVAVTTAISIFYIFTRYIKLGSLTAVAGGIEQSISVLDAFIKLLGYSLLTLQVPSPIIPAYMTVSLHHMGWVEIAVRLALFLSALLFLRAAWIRNRLFVLAMFLGFLFAFLPITIVSRNSPYYADLMMIPLALALALGADAIFNDLRSRTRILMFSAILACLVICATFFSARYIFNADMWLARAQGFARAALSDFASSEGAFDAEQIVGTSGFFGREQQWSLAHMAFGSGFSSNFGLPKDRFVRQSEMVKKNNKVLFVDFLPDIQPRKIGSYPLPGYGRMMSAYFPSGFVRRRLKGMPPVIEIKGAKVIRITCNDNSVNPLSISFKSKNKSLMMTRVLSPEMNIGGVKGKSIFDFIVPPGTHFLQLEQSSSCNEPVIDGYYDFETTALNFKTTISLSPRFENYSDWTGSVSKAPIGEGVIVGPGADNLNVLYQRVLVEPLLPYKILARASSLNAHRSTGRLQINWLDGEGRFISSDGVLIEVGKQEKLYETLVRAPNAAKAGILYVTPHAPEDVVRFTEMRVLGSNSSE